MKILCIDGHSILNRAFYGIKLLSNKNGVYTNAIYGFLNILLRIEDEIKPDAVAITFDLPVKTFRHKKYDKYKGTRKNSPQELRAQLPILKEVLTYLGYPIVEKEGYEADDILGTFSKKFGEQGHHSIIVTGDKDNLQLIDKNTTVKLAVTKNTTSSAEEIDEDKFYEMYNLNPIQLIDLKSLMGDSSDNIPGVAGVGEKTALKLIQKFDSLDGVYENIENSEIIKDSLKSKLLKYKDDAYMSLFLATIFCDVPVNTDINAYIKKDMDKEKVAQILYDLEMYSFIDKLSLNRPKDTSSDKKIKPNVFFNKVTFAFDDKLPVYLFMDDIITASQGENIYIYNLDFENIREFIVNIFKNYNLIVLDSKRVYLMALDNNIEVKNIIFDIILAAYLDNSIGNSYNFDKLIEYYNIFCEIDCDSEFFETLNKHYLFCSLADKLLDIIKRENLQKIYYDVELSLSEVLANMEYEGILVDKQDILDFGKDLNKKIDKLTQEIHCIAGEEFNINSPKQLSVILFEKIGLKSPKKTKTGYSTNAETLDFLRDSHPIIDLILEYRQYTKLNSTYVEGLLKVIGEDGKIHTTFNQTEARTGRISSNDPNLQNIPVRSELGREMRKFFKAKQGYVFVDADYSQIELRILAHISDDKKMLDFFNKNEDIHLNTASQVFGVPKDLVTSSMRNEAKAVNFGIVYGISAFSLSKDIKVTIKEAEEYINSYFNTFVGVKRYMENIVDFAEQNGFVTTVFGRKRKLPEILNSNKIVKSLGKRMAMNTPIQGTAADIIKIAMTAVFKRLKYENLDAKLILQVHDELIIECKENVKDRVKDILKQEMEKAANLNVKLVVDVNIGKDWYTAKG